MRITVLGTGTSQGIPVIGCQCEICSSHDQRDKRLRSSILISKNETNILIDVGPDFRQQMLRSKTTRLDAILITHEHNDHIAGLDDIRPFNFMSQKAMPIFALPRVAGDLKIKFAYIFGAREYPGLPSVQLLEINADYKSELNDIAIQAIDIRHGRLPILGFKLDDLVYLTDVKQIEPKEIDLIRGCHTLIISALRRKVHHSHANLEEALQIIEQIAPKQAFLTHISHDFDFHANILKELPPMVSVAYDQMQILIP